MKSRNQREGKYAGHFNSKHQRSSWFKRTYFGVHPLGAIDSKDVALYHLIINEMLEPHRPGYLR